MEGMFHVKRRRRGLRIIRFPASGKAHSLHRSSSSNRSRFAGLRFEAACGGGLDHAAVSWKKWGKAVENSPCGCYNESV